MNKNRLFLALLGFFNILNLNADDKKQQPPAGYDARVDWMKLLQYRQRSLPELFETFLDSINRNELNRADLIFRIINLYNRKDDEFQKLADKYPNESFPVRTPAQQAGTSAVLASSLQWQNNGTPILRMPVTTINLSDIRISPFNNPGTPAQQAGTSAVLAPSTQGLNNAMPPTGIPGSMINLPTFKDYSFNNPRTPAQQTVTSAVLAPSLQWRKNETPNLDGIKNKLRELWASLPEDDARRDLVDLLRLDIINQKHILEDRPVDGIFPMNAVRILAKDEQDLDLLKLIRRLNASINDANFKERIINNNFEKETLESDIRNLIQKKDTAQNSLIRRLADDVLEKLRNFFETIKEEE